MPGFDPEGSSAPFPAIGTDAPGRPDRPLAAVKTECAKRKRSGCSLPENFLLLLGAILDMWLPINKNLWTSSYTIFMAGWANVILAMFYWLIDVKGYKKWATPFVIYGMNAITVFVLSGVVARTMALIKWTAGGRDDVGCQERNLLTCLCPARQPGQCIAAVCDLLSSV